TDEPGIYIEGKYGVRIENDLLCVKDKKSEYCQFMRFEPLTLCPIDLRPVNLDELTAKELKTLKAYHDTVVEKLSPYLEQADRDWLLNAVKM
ncbi:MAG: M24 family metallopeptidase C-terminal domain-containing protein, partial [Lachnospiraceae bacterium]|nr:M24 family metallopeptidase C-terminal domain-containing protein [Lachnospiraceae bacterium]